MISIVIPVYNEESNIKRFVEVLEDEILYTDYEIIFVNDGSLDDSRAVIEELVPKGNIFCINFSRNFGQQAAIIAGLSYSRGDACIIMDADLQDNPGMLPQFIGYWQKGYEVVYGIKHKEKENFIKVLLRNMFYKIMTAVSEVHIPSGAGSFCLLDRKAVDSILKLDGKNLFFPGMRSWIGFRQIGIDVPYEKRFSGKPSVSIGNHFKLGFDAIFSFSYTPLRLVLAVGLLMFTVSAVFMLYILYRKYFTGDSLPGFNTLAVLISLIGSINLIAISILGEYTLRIYNEVKRRPLFIIKSILGQREENQRDGLND